VVCQPVAPAEVFNGDLNVEKRKRLNGWFPAVAGRIDCRQAERSFMEEVYKKPGILYFCEFVTIRTDLGRKCFSNCIDHTRELFYTIGTDTDKLQLVSDDFEIGGVLRLVVDGDLEFRRCIDDPVAVDAANMIVVFGLAVKALQATARFEFLDFTALGQDFKVAIDGPEADARKIFADHLVDFVSAGMGVHLAQFLENDPALAGHP